jgi:hypothetical protein
VENCGAYDKLTIVTIEDITQANLKNVLVNFRAYATRQKLRLVNGHDGQLTLITYIMEHNQIADTAEADELYDFQGSPEVVVFSRALSTVHIANIDTSVVRLTNSRLAMVDSIYVALGVKTVDRMDPTATR